MNPVSLALASIRSRRLHAVLCVASAAFGIALLCAVFLLSQSLEKGLMRNAHGIDVVAGAKGSPLQLVLSTIYHTDIPNGNIEMEDARKLARNPMVKKAIPVAIGDNYEGWRIVGTTPDYVGLYHGQLARGAMFAQPFEAVAGADTGLAMGTQFAALHGFEADSDDVHNFHLYKIVGVLKPTGTVLDRLIVTPVESVQQLHAHPDAGDPDAAEEFRISHQVTAMLLQVRSPIAVINLPRQINRSEAIMAASPAFVMARFSRSMGVGREVLAALSAGFVALSALMLFSALASGLAARRYDLAVLRVLGAPPGALAATVIAEGAALAGAGSVIGVIAGHGLAALAAVSISGLRGVVLPQEFAALQPQDMWLVLVGLGTGVAAGIFPALAAARTDIALLLAKGRT
jgi:putative ABC transport system permease protein